MNKKILSVLVLGILAVSLVSAGWVDFWRNAPGPNSGSSAQLSPSDFGLADLQEGVDLKIGWNYWYYWNDKEIPIKDVVSSLSGSLKYILIYDSNWKYVGYWYNPDYSSSSNAIDVFKPGYKYALRMGDAGEWRYSSCKTVGTEISEVYDIDGDGEVCQEDVNFMARYLVTATTKGNVSEILQSDSVGVGASRTTGQEMADYMDAMGDCVYDIDSVSGITANDIISLSTYIRGTDNSKEDFLKNPYNACNIVIFDANSCDAFKVSYTPTGESYYMRASSFIMNAGVNRVAADIQYWTGSYWESISDGYPGKRVSKGNVDFTIASVDKDNKKVTMYSTIEGVSFDNMCTIIPRTGGSGGGSGNSSTSVDEDGVYINVLEMLGSSQLRFSSSTEKTCRDICAEEQMGCLLGEVSVGIDTNSDGIYEVATFMNDCITSPKNHYAISVYETSSDIDSSCLCTASPF
jgi:hypothetical protein